MKHRRQCVVICMLVVLALVAIAGALSANPRLAETEARLYLPVILGEPGSVATGDLLVYGRVHERLAGPLAGIEGATVWITSCVDDWTVQTTTSGDGSFVLVMPEAYVNPCQTIVLGARADGYQSKSAELDVSDVRALPRRDIGLVRAEATPTPTSEPMGDLTIYGTVSRCGVISGGEIRDAVVSAEACTIANRSETRTDASGAYTVTLSADYLVNCSTIYLHASALGYQTKNLVLAADDLRLDPRQDICLSPALTMPPP